MIQESCEDAREYGDSESNQGSKRACNLREKKRSTIDWVSGNRQFFGLRVNRGKPPLYYETLYFKMKY